MRSSIMLTPSRA